MDVTLRNYMIYIVVLIFGLWIGFYIGAEYYPRVETKTVTNTVEKPIIVQGEARTETKTQIAYVPKETVIERYIDASTGKEVTTTKREATDLDATIGKADFNVNLNGKPVQFTKTDDEKFMFDKNKIAMTQNSTITFDAKVQPQVVDKTKRWGIGIGYGNHGPAGKVDFPIGGHDYFGGWIYGDQDTQSVGVSLKF